MLGNITLGFLFALWFIRAVQWQAPDHERTLMATGLGLAAALPLSFALWGAPAAGWVTLHLIGLVVFGAMAWLGLQASLRWLAVGWTLHLAWALGLLLAGWRTDFVPMWYPALCLGFDGAMAGYLGRRVRARRTGRRATDTVAALSGT